MCSWHAASWWTPSERDQHLVRAGALTPGAVSRPPLGPPAPTRPSQKGRSLPSRAVHSQRHSRRSVPTSASATQVREVSRGILDPRVVGVIPTGLTATFRCDTRSPHRRTGVTEGPRGPRHAREQGVCRHDGVRRDGSPTPRRGLHNDAVTAPSTECPGRRPAAGRALLFRLRAALPRPRRDRPRSPA